VRPRPGIDESFLKPAGGIIDQRSRLKAGSVDINGRLAKVF